VKALGEIGWGRALKFGAMTLAMVPYRLALVPQLRAPLLRLLGARIGRRAILHDVRFFNLYRRGLRGLAIGDDCFIGDECLLDLADEIRLERQVTLAERVLILTHMNVGYQDHPLQSAFPAFAAPVRIDEGSFVGASVTILGGVRIGAGSFVAAGSVVTKDVPPRSLVAGVPARLVRSLDGPDAPKTGGPGAPPNQGPASRP
jgi:maltose O-acetyltransferase